MIYKAKTIQLPLGRYVYFMFTNTGYRTRFEIGFGKREPVPEYRGKSTQEYLEDARGRVAVLSYMMDQEKDNPINKSNINHENNRT